MTAGAPHPAPPPGIALRQASSADAGAIARLIEAFNAEFDAEVIGAEVIERRLRARLRDGTMRCVVAERDRVLIGCALLSPRWTVYDDTPSAVLDEFYVVPALRSRGVGSALLDCAESFLRGAGHGTVEIHVESDDVGARRFYERHGYRNTDDAGDVHYLYYFRGL